MNNQEVQHYAKTSPSFFYGYLVVIAAFIIMVLMYGTRIAFGVFFKPILTEFGWSRALTSSALSISLVIQGLMSIVMGGLNDRFGPRIVLTLCGFLLGLGYLLMSQVNAIWQLYLFYSVLVGIGMSGVFSPLLSTVARWFVKRRSVMTGIVFAGAGAGNLIMPPVSNWLISIYDWRISYLIMGGLVLVIVVAIAQFLRRDPAQTGQVPYGRDERLKSGANLGAEGLSLKVATGTRQYWMTFAIFFGFGLCSWVIIAHIVPHATDLGISAATAANILAVMGAATIIGGIVLGNIADRTGIRQVFVFCFIVMSAALFGLLPATKAWMLFLFTIVFGFSSGGGVTLMSPLVAKLFGLSSHGLILGVMMFGFTLGGAVGPFVAGYIFDATGSYLFAFLLSAAFSVIGLILTAMLRPIEGTRD